MTTAGNELRRGEYMMQELLNAGIWNKTSQLILEKYGKKIEFKFLTSAESEGLFYTKEDDLVVPLKFKNQHLGEVVIHRGSTMSVDAKNEIADLIHFLIEPKVYTLHLKNKESELLNKQEPAAKTNVISLFRKIDDDSESDSSETKKTLSQIIHLRSKNPQFRHKVALKLHEMTGANLFFRLSDVSKSLHSLADLKSLSGTTIYIEHILEINKHEIELLNEFAQHPVEGIQFLIGSDLTDSEVEQLPANQELKNDLSMFSFDIDKVPLSQQTSQDVLELLFFNFESTIS